MWWLWMDYFLFQHFANKENEIDFKEQLISKHKNCPSPYGARGFENISEQFDMNEYPSERYSTIPAGLAGLIISRKKI